MSSLVHLIHWLENHQQFQLKLNQILFLGLKIIQFELTLKIHQQSMRLHTELHTLNHFDRWSGNFRAMMSFQIRQMCAQLALELPHQEVELQ